MDINYGLTGKHIQTPYSRIVEEQAPYALQGYLAEQASDMDEESLALNEEELDESIRQWEEEKALQEEIAAENAKNADTASVISGTGLAVQGSPYLKRGYDSVKSMVGGSDLPSSVDIESPTVDSFYTDPAEEYALNNSPSLGYTAPVVDYTTSVATPTYTEAPVPYRTPLSYKDPVDVYTAENPVSVEMPAMNLSLPSTSGLTSVSAPEIPMSFNDSFWGTDAVSRFGQNPSTLNSLGNFDLSIPSLASYTAPTSAAVNAGAMSGAEAGHIAASGVGGPTATPTVLGTVGQWAGPAAFGAMVLNNLSKFYDHFNKDDPYTLSPRAILEASEGNEDLYGGYKANIVEQDGRRYLYDPVYKARTGQDAYHDLSDESFLNDQRKAYAGEVNRSNFGNLGLARKEALQAVSKPWGRDQDPNQQALYNLRSERDRFNSAGRSSGGIRNTINQFRQTYDDITDQGFQGLG